MNDTFICSAIAGTACLTMLLDLSTIGYAGVATLLALHVSLQSRPEERRISRGRRSNRDNTETSGGTTHE